LQPPGHDAQQPLHERKSECRVFLACSQNLRTLEGQDIHAFQRPRLELLAASHQQRGPAQLVAREQGLHAKRMSRRGDLERDESRHDQVELRAIVALAKDDVIPIETYFPPQRRELLDMPGLELRHERMVAKQRENSLSHRTSPFLRASPSPSLDEP